ncbi:MAG TPA: hypothetical protein VJZ02_04350 [Candidatus Brocadiales bacterium]|nr:hypothetical protein [Candidatus Brocadiales bacterium]
MRWIIVLALITLLFSGSGSVAIGSDPATEAKGVWGGLLDAMPDEERGELVKIISLTCQEEKATPERHQKFWEIVDSNKWTKGDVQDIWDRILGRSCVSQHYMMLAVLDAFYNKIDTKGREFKDHEDRLIRLGTLTAEEARESDAFIYKVAHGEPVGILDIFGGLWYEKVFDDELARSYRDTFEQLDKQYRCLLKLFDRSFKDY